MLYIFILKCEYGFVAFIEKFVWDLLYKRVNVYQCAIFNGMSLVVIIQLYYSLLIILLK